MKKLFLICLTVFTVSLSAQKGPSTATLQTAEINAINTLSTISSSNSVKLDTADARLLQILRSSQYYRMTYTLTASSGTIAYVAGRAISSTTASATSASVSLPTGKWKMLGAQLNWSKSASIGSIGSCYVYGFETPVTNAGDGGNEGSVLSYASDRVSFVLLGVGGVTHNGQAMCANCLGMSGYPAPPYINNQNLIYLVIVTNSSFTSTASTTWTVTIDWQRVL